MLASMPADELSDKPDATQTGKLSYRSVVSVEETPIWSHMAAGWDQYICSCCHGYSQSPSTGFGTLVSVKI